MADIPYSNVDQRSFQVWNSDAKTYFIKSQIDLTSYLNDSLVAVPSGSFISLRRELNGSYKIFGQLEFTAGIANATTDTLIDLSVLLASKSLVTGLNFPIQQSLDSSGESVIDNFYLDLSATKLVQATTYAATVAAIGDVISLDINLYEIS